jgi:lactate racemase
MLIEIAYTRRKDERRRTPSGRPQIEHVPGGILAHSTNVEGTGTYDSASGVETPRIQVTLATGIPEERFRRVNLGYADYRTIDPREWAVREAEDILLVPHAGEMLYRAESLSRIKELM